MRLRRIVSKFFVNEISRQVAIKTRIQKQVEAGNKRRVIRAMLADEWGRRNGCQVRPERVTVNYRTEQVESVKPNKSHFAPHPGPRHGRRP